MLASIFAETLEHHTVSPEHRITPVARALQTLRRHLNLDIAFISKFEANTRVFKCVDAAADFTPIMAGDRIPITDGYCLKVVRGELPELIADTRQCREARAIPATVEFPIGAHLSVPLYLSGSRLYGTLCCFGRHPDPSLNVRDLAMMHAFAELIGQQIESDERDQTVASEKLHRIKDILASPEPGVFFQPIFRLRDRAIVGFEALARFASTPMWSPDKWFREAAEVGLTVELEQKAIAAALGSYAAIWKSCGVDLNINASPQTIVNGQLSNLLAGYPCDRIVIEITEHDQVEDYRCLREALDKLRYLGVRVAIDDAGSGYASMQHILKIAPDIIKLDVSLTRDIDKDQMKQALTSAFVAFAHQINSKIVSEGVETIEELTTLSALGVDKAQGYLLGRPGPVEAFADQLQHDLPSSQR